MTRHTGPRVSGATWCGSDMPEGLHSVRSHGRSKTSRRGQSNTGTRESVCQRHKTPLGYTFCGIPFCKECRREDRPEIDLLIAVGKSEAKRAHDVMTLRSITKKGGPHV